MEELKRIFLKPTVKACCLGILAFSDSFLCNLAVGNCIWWEWVLLVFAAGLNIAALIWYAKAEKDLIQELDKTKDKVENMGLSLKSYSTSLQGVAEICKFCAQKANIQIHEIIENSRLDCKTWNFDVACESVCKAIYQYILEHLNLTLSSGGIVDIEVAYVKLVEADKKQKNSKTGLA